MKVVYKGISIILSSVLLFLILLIVPKQIFACSLAGLPSSLNVGQIAAGGQIINGLPNSTYTLAAGSSPPSTCTVSPNSITTAPNGIGTQAFTVSCNSDTTLVVAAGSGSDSCSFSITVGSPSRPCVGESTGRAGLCVTAPNCNLLPGTAPDGNNGCLPVIQTCCVPAGPTPTPTPVACVGASTGRTGVCVFSNSCSFVSGTSPDGSCGPLQTCCVSSVGYLGPGVPAIFCDSSGNPTTDTSSGRLYTAIGCISIVDQNAFIAFIVTWAIGIAGGIAFLLIIYAAFLVITSGGNPQRLAAGKELLTAAVTGLLLLLFGMYILRLIGVQILNIPGF